MLRGTNIVIHTVRVVCVLAFAASCAATQTEVPGGDLQLRSSASSGAARGLLAFTVESDKGPVSQNCSQAPWRVRCIIMLLLRLHSIIDEIRSTVRDRCTSLHTCLFWSDLAEMAIGRLLKVNVKLLLLFDKFYEVQM